MKKYVLLAALCLLLQTTFAQIGFQFKVSKPYCVFSFMQAATGDHSSSSTLEQLIVDKTKGNKAFSQLCSRFRAVRLDYQYTRSEYPDSRRKTRSTFDLITIALVNSGSWTEFGNRIVGILPNGETKKFLDLLTEAELVYDQLIWKENEAKMTAQLEALEPYAAQCSEIFSKISKFYNSAWSSDIPFVVALYPIPGKQGNTSATPHANSLCVGVLTDETDHIGRVGVVLHEMCHVLYDEQPADFQHTLDGYFQQNKSEYKEFAYNFFDEGLATALGNGWASENLSGTLDPSDWYNNEYINGFGKALFPLVKEYLAANRTMDQAFVDKAIDLFAATFPHSVTDYGILLNRVSIFNDADSGPAIDDVMNGVGKYFQLTNSRFSSPILDPIALEHLKNGDQTQMIIIDRNHETTIKALKKIFPEISKLKMTTNKNYTFFDSRKRPVIILVAADKANLDLLLKEMKTKKYFDKTKIIQ